MVLDGLVGEEEEQVCAVRPVDLLCLGQQRLCERLAVREAEKAHGVVRAVIAQEDAALQKHCLRAGRIGQCVVYVLQGGGLIISRASYRHQIVIHQLAVRPQQQHIAASLGREPALRRVAAPLRLIGSTHRNEGTGVVVFVPVAVCAALDECGLQQGEGVLIHHTGSALVF